MVFMSSSVLDWHPILQGWLLTRPSQQQDIILQSFEGVFGELYTYMIQSLEPKMDVCSYTRANNSYEKSFILLTFNIALYRYCSATTSGKQ